MIEFLEAIFILVIACFAMGVGIGGAAAIAVKIIYIVNKDNN